LQLNPARSFSFHFNNLAGLTVKDGSEVDDVGDGGQPIHTFAITDTGGIGTTTFDIKSAGAQIRVGDANNSLDHIGTLILDASASSGGVTAALDDEAVNRTIDDEGSVYTFQSNPDFPSYTITNQNVQRANQGTESLSFNGSTYPLPPVGPYTMNLTYYNLQGLNLTGGPTGGSTGNVFNVQSKYASTSLGITAGSSGDTIKVGDATHSLNVVAGTVNIIGSTGTHLILDDEASQNAVFPPLPQQGFDGETDLNNPVYTVDYNQVQRTNNFAGTQVTVTYSNVANLEIDGANLLLTDNNGVNQLLPQYSNHNVFNVQSMLASTFLSITAGDGGDTIKVGDATDSLNDVADTGAGVRMNVTGRNASAVSVTGSTVSTSTHLILDDRATQNVKIDALPMQGFDGYSDVNNPVYAITEQPTYQQVQRTNNLLHTDIVVNDNGTTTVVGPFPETLLTTVTYTNVASLEVDGADLLLTNDNGVNTLLPQYSSSNTFNVQGVQAGTNLTIRSGDGKDQVNVGSVTNALDLIQGGVTVNGTGANSTLNVHDDGNPVSENYTVSPTTIQRSIIVAGVYNFNIATITYYTVGHVNVYVGTAQTGLNQGAVANTLDVVGTPAGAVTDLYGNNNGGQTAFAAYPYVFNYAGPILGAIHFHGSSIGLDTVSYVDYFGPGSQTYTMSAGQMVDNGFAPVTYDGRLYNVGLETSVQGGSKVNVLSTAPATAVGIGTGVNANAGDVVTVGSQAPNLGGTLAGLAGSGILSIHSIYWNSAASVILDDSTDPQMGKHVTFSTVSSVWEVDGLAPQVIELVLSTGSSVKVLGGSPAANQSGGNTYAVQSVPAGVSLTLTGGTGTDTLQGPNSANTWQITGANSGTLNGTVTFASVQNLSGGSASDAFKFQTGGSLAGRIDGGGGTNALDYSAFVGDVTVDLPLGLASAVASGILNIQNVNGSRGNDLIIGDANLNVLRGGTGRNLIIGGGGGDQIFGGGGDNLLIGGTTDYVGQTGLTALEAIMQEFLKTYDAQNHVNDFSIRVHNIRKGLGSLTNTGYHLDSTNVHADPLTDQLWGGAGLNWFFAAAAREINGGQGPSTNPTAPDVYTHVK
jgi:hypothetical protein